MTGLDAITFGEAMAMFVAQDSGPLHRASTFAQATAGAETNVATGLARLGHRSGWIGRLGDDPLGLFIQEELGGCGIDLSRVEVDHGAPTGFQLKSRADGGDPEVVYFRSGSAGSRLVWTEGMRTYVSTARHLHLTGIPLALSETTRDFALRAVDAARASGASVSFDPNLRPALWASEREMVSVVNQVATLADWVLPGVEEGRVLTGHSDPARIAEHYLAAGVDRVVVKNGCDGAVAFGADGTVRQPAFEVAVVDTVGAGDGFAAGLISAHLDGLEIGPALERAAAVGALATTSVGDKDGLPDREGLDRFLATRTVPAL
ncbi:MAG: sugar kinase, partial [Pseudonocardiaceae bacterium]